MLDHRPQTLALSLQIKLVDLRVEHRADNRAPLVRTQNSVTRMRNLRQIGANNATRGQAVNGLPTEPNGRQKQNHAHSYAKIEPLRTLAR